MKFSAKIFERATIKGMADYLLFGEDQTEERRDYETRLDEAYERFDKGISKYDEKEQRNLNELVNGLLGEAINVYMEIGLQSGILLMQDMIRNIEIEKQENKINYQKMYHFLFREITNATRIMEDVPDETVQRIKEILKESQCKTEEIYLEERQEEEYVGSDTDI